MSKPRILITVEGGIVQNISSNCDIEVVIADFDSDNSEQPVSIQGPGTQDDLFATGKAYKLMDKNLKTMDDAETELYEFLKENKF